MQEVAYEYIYIQKAVIISTNALQLLQNERYWYTKFKLSNISYNIT